VNGCEQNANPSKIIRKNVCNQNAFHGQYKLAAGDRRTRSNERSRHARRVDDVARHANTLAHVCTYARCALTCCSRVAGGHEQTMECGKRGILQSCSYVLVRCCYCDMLMPDRAWGAARCMRPRPTPVRVDERTTGRIEEQEGKRIKAGNQLAADSIDSFE